MLEIFYHVRYWVILIIVFFLILFDAARTFEMGIIIASFWYCDGNLVVTEHTTLDWGLVIEIVNKSVKEILFIEERLIMLIQVDSLKVLFHSFNDLYISFHPLNLFLIILVAKEDLNYFLQSDHTFVEMLFTVNFFVGISLYVEV